MTTERAQTPGDEAQHMDVVEDLEALAIRFAYLNEKLLKVSGSVQAYREYCKAQNVPDDAEGLQIAEELIKLVERRMTEGLPVELSENQDVLKYGQEVDHYRRMFRSLLHATMTASTTLDWGAASQKQSSVPMAFEPGLPIDSIPYGRYGSRRLQLLEKELEELFGFDREGTSLLMTSSGMSSYQLVESFLLRRVLTPGDHVLMVGDIYFETKRQLTGIPGLFFSHSSTGISDIEKSVSSSKPKAIFVEPMNNTFELRMVDIQKLIDRLIAMQLEEDIYVVVDGTMIPEGVDVFKSAKGSRIKVIYYASCGKYLQEGMDLTMAGLVVVDRSMESEFQNLRKSTGTILYEPAASLFPDPDKNIYHKRSNRMSRNALLLAESLEECPSVNVRFPKLPAHPDHAVADQYGSIGSVLTFSFREPFMNTPEFLEKFVDGLIASAKTQNIPVTEGVSFGFSHPRLTLAYTQDPFSYLRLSAGDRSMNETLAFRDILLSSIRTFVETNGKISL